MNPRTWVEKMLGCCIFTAGYQDAAAHKPCGAQFATWQRYAKIVIDFRAAKPLMVDYYCAGDVMFEIWWVIILHRESGS